MVRRHPAPIPASEDSIGVDVGAVAEKHQPVVASMKTDQLEAFARRLVKEKTYSALTLAGRCGDRTFQVTAGESGPSSLYDLASLTKPVVTTTALWLASEGRLALDKQLFSGRKHASEPTLEQALSHQAGARAWFPFYALQGPLTAEGFTESLADSLNWGHTVGTYSDVGYLAAARSIEAQTDEPLWHSIKAWMGSQCPQLIADREMLPSPVEKEPAARVLPCALDTDKEVELARHIGIALEPLGAPNPGTAQDGNARHLASRLGLLAGHAGLFGSARSMLTLGETWLHQSEPTLRRRMQQALHPTEGRLMGWFRSSPLEVDASAKAPDRLNDGFHHTGFTGGGLWVEPEMNMVAVMLGHRLDPMSDLTAVRASFRRMAVDALI